MIERPLWLERVRQAWTQRSVVWLSGVRRVGKTTIARMLPGAVYLNCDLPSSVRAAEISAAPSTIATMCWISLGCCVEL